MAVKSSINAQPSLFDEMSFKPVPPQKKKVVALTPVIITQTQSKVIGIDLDDPTGDKFCNYIININKNF